MKPVFLKFTDDEGKVTKTHVTCTLKSGTMDQILDVSEIAEKLGGNASIKEVRAFYDDLRGLLVGVFHHQFTLDELKAGAENSEIFDVFNELCARAMGEMQKN